MQRRRSPICHAQSLHITFGKNPEGLAYQKTRNRKNSRTSDSHDSATAAPRVEIRETRHVALRQCRIQTQYRLAAATLSSYLVCDGKRGIPARSDLIWIVIRSGRSTGTR